MISAKRGKEVSAGGEGRKTNGGRLLGSSGQATVRGQGFANRFSPKYIEFSTMRG
ncbi:hypothetical protein CA13_08370 [Planctomycetes bacterium CA13]|uniref:Uncharacterized protein n=1 Tax=Novipirellula herctigrandis TaxID=2527986 RepID=A0A5C5YXD3_9BACT|nr:hypothetical protein CA13_08370 [Planctomycetes bacterium CA13]